MLCFKHQFLEFGKRYHLHGQVWLISASCILLSFILVLWPVELQLGNFYIYLLSQITNNSTQNLAYVNWICGTTHAVRFSTWWDGRMGQWWRALFACGCHILAMAISLVEIFCVTFLYKSRGFIFLDFESLKPWNS